jgi:hypothetical protein
MAWGFSVEIERGLTPPQVRPREGLQRIKPPAS